MIESTKLMQSTPISIMVEPACRMGLINVIDANSPFTQSALIFIAQNDYYFYDMGLEVKTKFTNYTELISTSAGHALPTASDANFQSAVDLLANLDSSGSDTGDGSDDSSENLQSFRLNILQGDDLNNLQIIDTRIIESSSQNQFFKAARLEGNPEKMKRNVVFFV